MASIKTIGASGQITLGKEYSGKTVLVDEIEPGVWMVKVGEFIPDSERWLHEPAEKSKLDEAIAWAEANPACADNLAEIETAVHGR
jgi:hypothetical protein